MGFRIGSSYLNLESWRDCYGLQLLNRDQEVAPTGAYPSRMGFSMEPLSLWDFYHRDCYGLQLLNRDQEVAPTGTYPSRTGFSIAMGFLSQGLLWATTAESRPGGRSYRGLPLSHVILYGTSAAMGFLWDLYRLR